MDVDLVLDIGNSRTTGILVETHTQSATNLNDSYLLQLRDMDKPEKFIPILLKTRIEFCEASFGNEALSLRSGRRTPAFYGHPLYGLVLKQVVFQPDPAVKKAQQGCPAQNDIFGTSVIGNEHGVSIQATKKAPYVTRGTLAQLVNSSGTPLCCMNDPGFVKTGIFATRRRKCPGIPVY